MPVLTSKWRFAFMSNTCILVSSYRIENRLSVSIPCVAARSIACVCVCVRVCARECYELPAHVALSARDSARFIKCQCFAEGAFGRRRMKDVRQAPCLLHLRVGRFAVCRTSRERQLGDRLFALEICNLLLLGVPQRTAKPNPGILVRSRAARLIKQV